MSTKKDQYLESARKWVIKGQLDRAIKDYEQIITLDPTDMKHRQKLAELLVRVGRKVPAIKEYDVIGRFYAENGYYLKAIAVYKQIQKLDPEDLTLCLKLADYNRKQGLIGNALAEYGVVLTHYQQTGDIKETFSILEKMIEVDPENLDTLLKYAEARYAAGQWDDAYHNFSRLALLLLKRGDKGWFNRICERIRSLYPDRPEFLLTVLETQIDSGETAKAIPVLQDILKRDQYNLPAWQLLIRAYRTSGDTASYESALKYMIHFFPKEIAPREGLIQFSIERVRPEDALALISAHQSTFLAQQEFGALERLCHSLLPLLQNQERLLPVLKRLYDASGEPEKFQAFLTSLAEEDAGEGTQASIEAEAEQDAAVTHEAGNEDFESTEDEYDAEDDLWEEEIDLSLLEELTDGIADEVAVVGDEAYVAELQEAEETIPTGGALNEGSVAQGLDDITPLDWLSGPPSSKTGEELLFSEEDLPDFSEFSTALDDLFKDEPSAPPASRPDKYGTEEVLAAFRKVLDEQLEPNDSASHYDLGIAYKEMGLFDDAVKEFKRAALGNPARLMDCLTLQGICYRDKGDADAAEESFKTAIGMDGGGNVEQQTSARYDLALLYEMNGRHSEAHRLYREVEKLSPGFRDVAAKLGTLPGEEGEILELDAVD